MNAPTPELASLIDAIASRHPKRELYQPIFGLDVQHSGPIQRECVERCELVVDSLKGILDIKNATVLDVGCNMGYVSFYLSQHFSKSVGAEVDKTLVAFCDSLRKQIGSRAEFINFNFFERYETLERPFDVCLLFSVIHYLVGAKGIVRAGQILADIVSRFDFVIIELSSDKDYPYMPQAPEVLIDSIPGYRKTRIGTSEKNDRSIFLLQRTHLRFLASSMKIQGARFAVPTDKLSCSRVYRLADSRVVKTFPINYYQNNRQKHSNEVAAYQILKGDPRIPNFLGFGDTGDEAWIMTEGLRGTSLNRAMSGLAEDKKLKVLCHILAFALDLLERHLYWNDLSSHNVILDDSVRMLDFAETAPNELHDHLAMFAWIIHDLAHGKAASYEGDIYLKIHKAGTNTELWPQNRPDGKSLPSELKWLHDAIVRCPTLASFASSETKTIAKVREIASLPL